MEHRTVSDQTRNNWLLDIGLMISAAVVAASSLYFLYLPSGGYRGGRNPAHNLQILFSRSTWDDLHTWGGAAMIVIALAHLLVHWKWVLSMARRIWRELTGQCACMNGRSRFNVAIDLAVAASFLLAALSGVYFLFIGGSRGGANPDPMILFSRTTWDIIHTWSGVVLIIAAVVHFVIHWRWVVKVTHKVFRAVIQSPLQMSSGASGE